MKLAPPYPAELLWVARKVVWYDAAERTLDDIPTFVAHLMVYGSPADVQVVEKYMSREEFRKALANAPSGIFTQDAWTKWHEKLGIRPIPPLPRRQFPDGTLDQKPGDSWGVRSLLESALASQKKQVCPLTPEKMYKLRPFGISSARKQIPRFNVSR